MKIYLLVNLSSFGKIISLLLLTFLSIALKAQIYGCHVQRGMSEVIYDTPYGAGSPIEWQTVISGPVTTTGEIGGYKNNNTSNGCIADIGGACTVYQQYEMSVGPPQVIGMRPYKYGIYASLNPTNCPIDDYIPSLFIFAIGIFYIKLKNIPSLGNESKHHHRSVQWRAVYRRLYSIGFNAKLQRYRIHHYRWSINRYNLLTH